MTTQHTAYPSPFEMAQSAALVADDRKAKDIVMLHTEPVSSLADYFVIATVDSRSQMVALVDHLLKHFRQGGIQPYGQQIDQSGRWSLLDFGDVIIHILDHEDREYYHLERFWNHANEIPSHVWLKQAKQAS